MQLLDSLLITGTKLLFQMCQPFKVVFGSFLVICDHFKWLGDLEHHSTVLHLFFCIQFLNLGVFESWLLVSKNDFDVTSWANLQIIYILSYFQSHIIRTNDRIILKMLVMYVLKKKNFVRPMIIGGMVYDNTSHEVTFKFFCSIHTVV